jgi:hypothetical protein
VWYNRSCKFFNGELEVKSGVVVLCDFRSGGRVKAFYYSLLRRNFVRLNLGSNASVLPRNDIESPEAAWKAALRGGEQASCLGQPRGVSFCSHVTSHSSVTHIPVIDMALLVVLFPVHNPIQVANNTLSQPLSNHLIQPRSPLSNLIRTLRQILNARTRTSSPASLARRSRSDKLTRLQTTLDVE